MIKNITVWESNGVEIIEIYHTELGSYFEVYAANEDMPRNDFATFEEARPLAAYLATR